jgi:ABC-type uncharacterized transport system substrate-binding protein
MSMKPCYSALLAALLAMATPATAHPDVSASARLVFDVDGNRLVGLSQILVFDHATSRRLVMRFDENRDGTLSDRERAELTREMLDRLSARQFFIEAAYGPSAIAMPEPTSVKLDLVDENVAVMAEYRWSAPLVLLEQAFSVMLRDRDFMIAFRFDPETPAIVSGTPLDCEASVAAEPKEAYFGGLVIPQMLRIMCR